MVVIKLWEPCLDCSCADIHAEKYIDMRTRGKSKSNPPHNSVVRCSHDVVCKSVETARPLSIASAGEEVPE